jgi:hypothetical protein
MRITYLGHASLFIELGAIRILSDPWWAGPCFGAQWWLYPGAFLDPLADRSPTHIYISHGHNDHLHPGTLARFPRDAKILVSKELDIAPGLEAMGFPVLQLADGERAELGSGIGVTIRPTVGGDTMMTVSDGREVCVNLNDALHAASVEVQDRFLAWLKKEYPVLDYLFCGYGTASHFPNCYRIPGKDYALTAAARQHHFNQRWARIVQELNPHFAFPFAADVVLLDEDLFWANEPVHNSERPVELLKHNAVPSRTRALDIAPGFAIDKGEITREALRQPLSSEALRSACKAQIERANYRAEVTATDILGILPMLEENLRVCDSYLSAFPGSYKTLLRFHNAEHGIQVAKTGQRVAAEKVSVEGKNVLDYDLVFTTRFPYLKRSLGSKYGSEILFVGSGCLFDFPDRETVSRKVHEELREIVRQHDSCPAPRYDSPSLVSQAKKIVKRALGMPENDLYDLARWTVFKEAKYRVASGR